MSLKSIERELFWTRVLVYVLLSCFILVCTTSYILVSNLIPKERSTKVVYDHLNNSQISSIENILKDLKPEYFEAQKLITFTSNISKDCAKIDCIGVNYRKGDRIYVSWYDDTNYLKELICHELLHTFIWHSESAKEELIVEELSKTLQCFNNFEVTAKV